MADETRPEAKEKKFTWTKPEQVKEVKSKKPAPKKPKK
jgi:hypothetical protein